MLARWHGSDYVSNHVCLIQPAIYKFPGKQGKKTKIWLFLTFMPYWNPDPIQKFLEFIKKKASLLIFPEPNFYFKKTPPPPQQRYLFLKPYNFFFFFLNTWEAWNQDSNKITWVLLFSDVIQLQKLHIMFVSFRQQKWIFLLLSLTKYQIFYQHLLEIVKTTRFFYFKKTQLGCQQILNFFSSLFLSFWYNLTQYQGSFHIFQKLGKTNVLF